MHEKTSVDFLGGRGDIPHVRSCLRRVHGTVPVPDAVDDVDANAERLGDCGQCRDNDRAAVLGFAAQEVITFL